MATSEILQIKPAGRVAEGRYDKYFFNGIAILILATVFAGFARSYFLAGIFWSHLPSILVHIHALLFTSWIALVTTQIALMRIRQVHWHRTLGVVGAVLAPPMVLTAFPTLIGFIRRHAAPVSVLQAITFGDSLALCIFSICFVWGYVVRRDPAAHKRLMLLATFSLLGPAIARWPNVVPGSHWFGFFCLSFPALLVIYDLVTRRSLHRSTICGTMLIVSVQLSFPLAQSKFMNHIVVWLQRT